MITRHAIALTMAVPLFGASLALGFTTTPAVHAAHAQTIDEDQPGWSCVADGNRICGPGNPGHVPAGCYDEGGVRVAPWPCHMVINPATGDADVYTGLAGQTDEPQAQ